jgi:D-alanyl-D-alanine carboxypeptidase
LIVAARVAAGPAEPSEQESSAEQADAEKLGGNVPPAAPVEAAVAVPVLETAAPVAPPEAAAPVLEAAAPEAPTEAAVAPPAPEVVVPAPPAILPPFTPLLPQPRVSARTFAIVDRSCGALAYGVGEHVRLAPASLTKIITAMVVERLADHNAMVDIKVDGEQMARRGSSVMGLKPNTQVSVIDLLYGLFLPSGNDAALALAQHVGGGSVEHFVQLMNEQMAQLQLQNSHFTNPHGLDDAGLYSSAYDMAMAGRAFLEDPELAQISVTPNYTLGSGLSFKNGNKLLQLYPGAFGVKIGFTTNAHQTIVAAAERDGRQLIVSVFGSDDRYSDTIALFDWAFSSIPSRCPA